ncbi:hypothetical protein IE53DRAFT_39912 [Violaceomyces palustris]|uniref:Uncharacterized protein n=1 Tax=Violaceomyces palustris TaxID=1673888 RepID=A0ACD0P0T2_9BASI|nr:hypothetical protein IE53DRAFT_39912 [Violaceomyces palustris]
MPNPKLVTAPGTTWISIDSLHSPPRNVRTCVVSLFSFPFLSFPFLSILFQFSFHSFFFDLRGDACLSVGRVPRFLLGSTPPPSIPVPHYSNFLCLCSSCLRLRLHLSTFSPCQPFPPFPPSPCPLPALPIPPQSHFIFDSLRLYPVLHHHPSTPPDLPDST